MDNPLLTNLGKKLNISCNEVLQKALEFLRVVHVRCGSGCLASLNLSGSSTTVICLEIAALSSGLSTDKPTAIKLSGMPRKLYQNAYKAIECILGKQKRVTIRDLAIMYGCISSVTLAEQVLKRYKESFHGDVDFNQPIFAASSLYIVCRNQKVRIQKTKLINQLSIKKKLFDNVCKQIQAILEKMPDKTKEKHSKRPYSWLENSLEETGNNDLETKRTRMTETDQNEKRDTDYKNWKLKILNATTKHKET